MYTRAWSAHGLAIRAGRLGRTETKVELASIATQKQSASERRSSTRCVERCGKKGRTFSDVMPPGRVEGVAGAPAGDVRAVRVAGAVLVLIRRSDLRLPVQLRERVDVTLPSA